MTNEAAERLRLNIREAVLGMDDFWGDDADTDLLAQAMSRLKDAGASDLDAALVAERRATVERIRLEAEAESSIDADGFRALRRILDEEAAR